MTVTPLGRDQDCSLKIRDPDVPASWFLDPGGWSKTATVSLYFIFPGICTLSLILHLCPYNIPPKTKQNLRERPKQIKKKEEEAAYETTLPLSLFHFTTMLSVMVLDGLVPGILVESQVILYPSVVFDAVED
ncbi:hypothetical protein STEG23_003254 [Scotinomys teguina]